MKEIIIEFDKKSPSNINEIVNIEVGLQEKEKDIVEYKFIEGESGIWKPIKDFSEENICKWMPEKPGKYMIMVQGKSEKCKGSYDCLGRAEYIVEEIEDIEFKNIINIEKNIIEGINIDKNIVNLGEKITINVETGKEFILFRFWIKGKQDWELLRDYTTDSEYTYTTNSKGTQEFLIECKEVNSSNNFDEFKTAKIEVKGFDKIEITDFKCLNNEIISNEELIFKVETNYKENRPILYKFIKVKDSGKLICIQEYSSQSTISFKESQAGDYKLRCLVRDMFSDKAFDDIGDIAYTVKAYEKIKINKLSTDISSPQSVGKLININTMVSGGKELQYRFIVEGPIVEDSGYKRTSNFVWEPTEEGRYKITLKVKDISFKGEYEDINTIEYEVYKKNDKTVRITEVKSEKGKRILVGESSRISTKIEGGGNNIYKFVVYKDGIESERIDYSKNNWVNFTPESCGSYEITAMVKDMYSIREYDSSMSTYIDAKDYVAAHIDCLLVNSKEIYLVNEEINIEPILTNNKEVVLNYITKINGQEVENTGFGIGKSLNVIPRHEGKYTITVLAKNIKSTEEYDSKKDITIYVHDVRKVTSTKVSASKNEIKIGEAVEFNVESNGGKDVCYKFYISNKDKWILVQNYSRKNYYSFIPFTKGEYRILVLSKSYHKNNEYEDYDAMTFTVVS